MVLPYTIDISDDRLAAIKAKVVVEDATPTTPEEKDLLSRRAVILDWETGYNHQQETRPQTRLGLLQIDSVRRSGARPEALQSETAFYG